MDIGLILAAASEATLADTLSGVGMTLLAWLGVGLGLTFVIFVHELGHFLVAKACGVKCEKFYVGFDFFEIPIPFTKWRIPRSLIKFQYGETEYGLGSLPLGGYVKMLGQDDDPRNAESEAERIRMAATAHPEQASATGSSNPEEAPVPAQTVEGKTVLLDPRSYPAKSVPARMAIISAGVIMNLIFAVILAAVAFRLGVRETPATIGAAAPGSPAWEAGIVPGSKILQIGKGGQKYDHLRFEDLTTSVILNGYDRDLPFLIRNPDGQEKWYDIRPGDRLKSLTGRPTVGVTNEFSREIRVADVLPDYLQAKSNPPLEDKDKVIAAEGQRLEAGADSDLSAIMAQNPMGPLHLTIERQPKSKPGAPPEKPQTLEVTVAPRPMREVGVVMEIGPIVAIRKGSPADEADFQEGDVIVSINGEPVGDPISLPQRLVPKSAMPEPITFEVARNGKQSATKTITVTPEMPRQSNHEFLFGGPTAIESLGIAYSVTAKVAAVEEGSPAGAAGIEAGDVLQQVEFVFADDGEKDRKNVATDMLKPIVLDDNLKNWLAVFTRMQIAPPDAKLKLSWTRGGKSDTATMEMRDSTTHFDETRGLTLYGKREPHQAKTWGEAFRLGFREATERVKEVVLILHSLVTGQVSATNLSGPAGIIYAAGNFASEGLSSLLIFLTILSANLAVLNFLPIPALDGGHLLFLAAEGIRGKPVDERLQIRLTIAGVICLLSLMVFATAMDIGRFAEMIGRWF